jgi:hypothetical protein
VRGQLQTTNNPTIVQNALTAPDANSYVESGTNTYTLCRLL